MTDLCWRGVSVQQCRYDGVSVTNINQLHFTPRPVRPNDRLLTCVLPMRRFSSCASVTVAVSVTVATFAGIA